jgi:4-amino-4-deoxy-L-arabinose transferase-like glycosyltransferase
MYCPQCGQQQATEEMRFCSRCGFPLGVITEVLARGGVLATHDAEGQGRKLSPRQRGVRQGAMLMLSALLIVPLMVFAVLLFHSDFLIPLIPLSAVVCVVGGFIRIAYALMLEDVAPPAALNASTVAPAMPFASAQLNAPVRGTALPPAQQQQQGTPLTDWRRRPETSEIVQPTSVTENTTKLLEKEAGEQG